MNANRAAGSVAKDLESGMVDIDSYNIAVEETPFGGVGESEYGWEGGSGAWEIT